MWKNQQLHYPVTDGHLFEVLTCDQRAIRLTLLFSNSGKDWGAKLEHRSDSGKAKTSRCHLRDANCPLDSSRDYPQTYIKPSVSLHGLPADMWVTDGVSHKGSRARGTLNYGYFDISCQKRETEVMKAICWVEMKLITISCLVRLMWTQ